MPGGMESYDLHTYYQTTTQGPTIVSVCLQSLFGKVQTESDRSFLARKLDIGNVNTRWVCLAAQCPPDKYEASYFYSTYHLTFGGAGNGDYRGELLHGLEVVVAYQCSQGLLPGQALVRLDGLYGDGAIVADLRVAGVGWTMRGKDYGLLDLAQVKERLALPADERFVHPESGTCRDLFDCGELPMTAEGHHCRVIVATHPASTPASPVGATRNGMVYELFFTALPAPGFTAADVVKLYLHREASRRCSPMRIGSKTVIAGARTRHTVRSSRRFWHSGCGTCVKT